MWTAREPKRQQRDAAMHRIDHEPRHTRAAHPADVRDAKRDAHRREHPRHRAGSACQIPERARPDAACHFRISRTPPRRAQGSRASEPAPAIQDRARSWTGACGTWTPRLALEVAPPTATLCPRNACAATRDRKPAADAGARDHPTVDATHQIHPGSARLDGRRHHTGPTVPRGAWALHCDVSVRHHL